MSKILLSKLRTIQVIYFAGLVTCYSGYSVVTYFEVSQVWNVLQ